MKSQEKGRIPEGFTLAMALGDMLPVVFFSMSALLIALRFRSLLFLIGVFLVILAGALKVGWKLIIVLKHRDLPFLNRQMRYVMPTGFACTLLALCVDHTKWSLIAVITHITSFPALLLFLIGCAGLVYLGYLGKHQNSRDAKANWKEQGINTLSQFCIMLGILLATRI
jgi:hypothetical protein